MELIIDGLTAVVKRDLNIEYVAENPDFDSSGDYTFAIQLPIKDCPENRLIFGNIDRADFELNSVARSCSIVSGKFRRHGVIVVKKASESEVDCQFIAGRSVFNYNTDLDDIFINEIELGTGEQASTDEVAALPWITDEGNVINAPESFSRPDGWHIGGMSGIHAPTTGAGERCFMPYLIFVAKKVCQAVGLSYDFSRWEDSEYRHLLVCNSLPGSWSVRELARALPHWSVKEFFSQLEKFLNGHFYFDFSASSVSFRFRDEEISSAGAVLLDAVSEHSVEYTDDDAAYEDNNMLSYAERPDEQWKVLSCDWYLKDCQASMIRFFDTLAALNEHAGAYLSYEASVRPGALAGEESKLFYAADVDTFFVLKRMSKSSLGNGYARYSCQLVPVNIYGSARYKDIEDQEVNTEEIKIVPARVDFTDEEGGYCLFLSPASFGESYDDEDAAISQSGPLKGILRGRDTEKPEYYSLIYVAFWSGESAQSSGFDIPYTDNIYFDRGHTMAFDKGKFSMRLNNGSRRIFDIDAKAKYEFKFFAVDIPDTKAVFFIKGQAFVCKKISAQISQRTGLSKLMKGEFYKIKGSRLSQ